MSFSTDVKEELFKLLPHERHCRLSELTAILAFSGKRVGSSIFVYPTTETKVALRKCFTLLSKTFNINTDILGKDLEESREFIEFSRDNPDMVPVLDAIAGETPVNLLVNDCCKRAYLRGVFISAGYIEDPNKAYHLEFVCQDEASSEMLKELLSDFDIEARSVLRKKYYVVYIKGADAIQDALSVMEAHKALMELVNVKIYKDFRNDTNRRVNCEVANSAKAVSAGERQIADINLIISKVGLDKLPKGLSEVAALRLEHPEISLTELGQYLDPPVGKSGVNHRLRKISEFADSLRQ